MNLRPSIHLLLVALITPLFCFAGCKKDEVIVDYTCGDGICNGSEDPGTCPGDCPEICGDGTPTASEVCDDGNTADGDGCSADCQSDESCGNGVLDTAVGEVCDDGGTNDGDGCSADCRSDETCGNGVVDGVTGEECDGAGQGCLYLGLGYTGGDATCSAGCLWDTSGCTGRDGALTWVTIPGGVFQMGNAAGESDEQPVHTVTVPAFELTMSEITVEQYALCVTDGSCSQPETGFKENWNDPGYEAHPVNGVTWLQAVDFCVWAGGRLPSEAEWEFAARSGGQDIPYPWGTDEPSCDRAVITEAEDHLDADLWGCGTGRTMAVCSKPAGNTSHGLCDMAGNVNEWLQDWYHDSYTGAPDDGSAWEDPPGTRRVKKGGSYGTHDSVLSVTWRNVPGAPGMESFVLGFRCAR